MMTVPARRWRSFVCAVVAAATLLATEASAFQPLPDQQRVPSQRTLRGDTNADTRTGSSTHTGKRWSSPSSSSSPSATIDERSDTHGVNDARVLEQVTQMLRDEALQVVKETTDSDHALAPGSEPDLPNVYELQTIQDYKKIVEDSDNRLTVVQFSAPFCLACRASLPLVRRVAQDMPDVNFVLLTVTKQNRYDVRDLGVPSLPYGYVHHPQRGLVEKLSTNKRHLADVVSVVESYQKRECILPDEVESESGVYASPFVRAA